MEKDLGAYRREYKKSELLESEIPDNPLQLFQTWFYDVEKYGNNEEANAMTISTIGLDNFPKNRVVLLKRYTYEGFIFFTNYDSEKGKAIEANPNVCLSFFWSSLERQVIIKGVAEKVERTVSENYFDSRPDGSKLGAIVSHQSSVIPNREALDLKLKQLEKKYENKEIPKPENWGGYLVRPISIEFWQGRPNRLHDRIRYTLKDWDWKIERLAP
ncbi:pyridoxamine 5'-phosphate oxidase [Abyssalbus ytuae]|uniref:Pyridoxine/pyridoxamine 5'-phosphate oxidase n=1 Tax=Abyssalbus ytuae TaxID=2926907 RepID=A0A9E6ZXY2_9FLAO|nr:pyridoxamine 5'-phosphate oxidase [Abyssalbus ytuae]UOB17227.1 pyridoxamine 5'-phosphate oxidase [Abyssalbus ytuae]